MSELTRFSPKQTMDSTTFQITHSKDTYLPYLELHHHDFYEIYFFISGNVSMSIEGKHYKLLPGDMILINTLELHQALIHDPAIPYERIVLWVNKSFLKSLSTPLTNLESCFSTCTSSNNLLRCTESIIDAIHITLKKILEAKKATSFGSDILYHTYLTELLVLINRAFENTQASCIYQHHYSELVSNCIEYIHDHIEEDLSLDTLAQTLYTSKYHLIREFKKYTGLTVHRYMIKKKLAFSKELILKDYAISEVYKRCGFGDYSNFFRAFKQEYGMTPKEFYFISIQKLI